MMYARWAASFLASFSVNIFLWIFADLVALIPALFRLSRLPGWLWYLQTHDDDVYGSRFTNKPIPATWWSRWRTAAWWLRRNPGYAFDAMILGLDEDIVRWKSGNSYTIGDKGFGYKRDIPLVGHAYLKVWLGWHYQTRGEGGKHMLKIAFGPKFGD